MFPADNWNFNSSNPCLHVGGNYDQNQNHGLFYVNYNRVSNANANIGCRVLSKDWLPTSIPGPNTESRGTISFGAPWRR